MWKSDSRKRTGERRRFRRRSIRRIRVVRRAVAVGCRISWSAPNAIISRSTVCGMSSQPWHWKNGLDIKTLSAVLGHSSAETTISVYSHVTGEMERNAAKKMDDAFGTPKPADSPVCDDNHEDGQTPKQEQKTAEFTAKRARSASPARDVSPKFQRTPGRANIRPAAKTASGSGISSTQRARRSARGN